MLPSVDNSNDNHNGEHGDLSDNDVAQKEAIKVCVRIRPMSNKEKKRGDEFAIEYDNVSVNVNSNATHKPKGNNRDKGFTFDRCFGPDSTQDEVFSESGISDLLKYAIDGYASTVFAYGQTGCGKTYTIVGEDDAPGIVPRSAIYIFDYLNQMMSIPEETHQIRVRMRASCLEIYQEQVNDLLNLRSVNLPVRWSNKDGFFVENLCLVEVENLDELMTVFNEGVANRKVSSHELNRDSSRSHSIFSIHFDISSTDPVDGFHSKRYGSIRFVDLAGSEKLKISKSKSVTETSSINKSLLTLGKVISLLSSPKKDNPYIPYRDSKLTKLLMDSLGGESKTLMIACLTPSSKYAEETLKTLIYAGRVKKIKNIPISKMDPKEKYILKLKEEIKLLRDEVALYKAKALTVSPKTEKSFRHEVKSSVVEFPLVERKRVSAKNMESITNEPLFESKLPLISSGEKRNLIAKVEDDVRGLNGLLKIVERNDDDNEDEEIKRAQIHNSIESLKSLLEEERHMHLEKIPQLKAKIKLLTEDNRRWKRIVRHNMDFDSEDYEKLKIENKYLKQYLASKGLDPYEGTSLRRDSEKEATRAESRNDNQETPPPVIDDFEEHNGRASSQGSSHSTSQGEDELESIVEVI
ncbi:hypothetical protein C9374_010932 [Naegleria lovaniensis]|uniref:Kinesin-like protein n=1 Tax=Naegleria lovaniensis TaxID=51637 RepID=A0AA88KIY7_NAELO|nr:uncharacterized protein C9374_010932 [Naegleria lovaniensis]KAG2374362.1 hypothetical protein C9374_010932 [Naegleria lovaniensis]